MRIIEKQTNKWDQFAQLIPLLRRTGRLEDAQTVIEGSLNNMIMNTVINCKLRYG